jgi:GAF domain-containing protein
VPPRTLPSHRVIKACRAALHALRQLVPHDLGTVWLKGPEGFWAAASVGRPFDLIEEIGFASGEGLKAWILEAGRTVRIPTRGRGFRFDVLRGYLGTPIWREGHPVGVITLGRIGSPFSEEDAERLREVAVGLGTTIADLEAKSDG